MKNLLIVTALAILFMSCSKPHKVQNVERAFYFWKSQSYGLWEEDTILKSAKVKKLYVKFFEVEKNELMGSVPIAKTQLAIGVDEGIEVVPTVYIKNEVFFKATNGALDSLADNVNFLIAKYANDKFDGDKKMPAEYQMDCDWTPKTKDNYFYFLKKLKQISQKQISCTLRLYPYKYPDKMGVPPVDKVMLMCYNLVHPLDEKNKNSILDLDELKAYLNTRDDYPLHLDIALPAYSWTQVYQNNKFASIMYGSFKPDDSYVAVKPMWYQATRDTVINDFFIRKGDMLKLENVTPQKINDAINIIKKYVALDANTTIALFHLDSQQLNQFSHEQISDFYSAFTK
jgi:hypothetical protein